MIIVGKKLNPRRSAKSRKIEEGLELISKQIDELFKPKPVFGFIIFTAEEYHTWGLSDEFAEFVKNRAFEKVKSDVNESVGYV